MKVQLTHQKILSETCGLIHTENCEEVTVPINYACG